VRRSGVARTRRSGRGSCGRRQRFGERTRCGFRNTEGGDSRMAKKKAAKKKATKKKAAKKKK
jgi:hypothetical protein